MKTRKKRGKTGGKWPRYGLKGVKESRQALRRADTWLLVLSGALDHAFKTQQQLSEGHASAIAALSAENKRLKSRLSGGSKRKDGEAAELRTQVILPAAPAGVSNEGGRSLAGCFLAPGSVLGLVGTASSRR